jgi:hypothetical protein
MKSFRAHSTLRIARSDAHLVGIRQKMANAPKDVKAPAAAGGEVTTGDE